MKAKSFAQHSSVISRLQQGYSLCQIEAKTGLGKSTVGRINEIDEGKENNKAGHPPKLAPWDKQSICHQMSSGKLDNAVQATHYINNAISSPVSASTVKELSRKTVLICCQVQASTS